MTALIVSVCFGWSLAVVIHELGHAVIGRLAGLGVAAVGIGFGISPTVGLRLFGCRLYVGEGSGGLTIFVPRRWTLRRWQSVAATAGGPAASLAAAAVSGSVWLAVGGTWWAAFAVINLVATVLTLVPYITNTPVGPLPSDGLALRQLFGPPTTQQRAVAVARQYEPIRLVIGEPRPFALYADLAAIDWALVGAVGASARWRAEADAARVAGVGRLEYAVDVLAVGVLARVGGDRIAAAERLAEVRRLVPDDPAFLEYAVAALTDLSPADPWFLCWWLRRAASDESDPGLAADLYAEAVRAAFAGVPSLGDHADDLAAFVGVTDDMLLAYRRAVRTAGGNPQATTRELLEPIYAGWRIAVPTPVGAASEPTDPIADRRSWKAALKLAGGQLAFGGVLFGLALAGDVRVTPLSVRMGAMVGLAAIVWAVASLLVAAAFRLMPSTRPGRDSGRTLYAVAVAAVVLAGVQAAVTVIWVIRQ